jgi:hypothetical protein
MHAPPAGRGGGGTTRTWSTLLFTTSTGMANPTPALLPAIGKPRHAVHQHRSEFSWQLAALAESKLLCCCSHCRSILTCSTKAVPHRT